MSGKESGTSGKEVGRDVLEVLRSTLSPESLEKLKQGLRDRIADFQKKGDKTKEQLNKETLRDVAQEFIDSGGNLSIHFLCLKYHVSYRRLKNEVRSILDESV